MLLDGSNLQESEQYQRDGVALSDLTNRLREYNAERRSMENSGTDIQTPHLADGSVFATMGATAQAAFEDMTASIRKAQAAAVSAIQSIPVVGQVASSAAYIGSRAFKAMSAVMKGVGPAIKTASGAFGALLKSSQPDCQESGNLPEESSKEIMLSVVELENYSNTVLVFEVCMHCSASFEMPW